MTEHHAFGVAGAARGVLNERGRGGVLELRQRSFGRAGRERGRALDRGQRSDQPLQQRAKPQPLGHRDQHAGAGIAQDAGLAAGIVLDLGALHRRIDRHRHRADVENPEECREEIDAGRQHERDPVSRHDVAFDQAGCDRACRLARVARRSAQPMTVASSSRTVTCRRSGCWATCHSSTSSNVRASAAAATAVSDGATGSRLATAPGRARLLQRAQQIADGIRLADQGDRQPGAERALEAQDQLGAAQAVDAQIPLEPARQGYLAGSRVLGMKLASQFADDREQGAFPRVQRRRLACADE